MKYANETHLWNTQGMNELLRVAKVKLERAKRSGLNNLNVAVVDTDFCIRYSTRGLPEEGYSFEEIVNQRMADFMQEDTYQLITTMLQDVFDGETRTAVLSGVNSNQPYLLIAEPLREGKHHGAILYGYLADHGSGRSVSSQHDRLTGLHTREVLIRRLEDLERTGQPCSLALLSLKNFRRINDTCGSHVGNEVLRHIALRLSELGVFCARVGSDEFALLLESDNQHAIEHMTASALSIVKKLGAIHYAKQTLTISAAAGIVLSTGGMGASETLVEADLAMLEATERGDNQYAVSGAHDNSRTSWLTRVYRALENDEFALFAQPIIDLQTRTIHGYEALVRMVNDDGSPISPGLFLPIAERFGLIHRIDEWVVRHAVAVLGEHPHLNLSVNFSGNSINHQELLHILDGLLAENSLQPGQLTVEITETALIDNIDNARLLAEILHRHGCRLSLDDFGTGFASLYYLKHIHFDYIKIDGEFIKGSLDDDTDQFVIELALLIANKMGCRAVAEFVEDGGTADYLQTAGVPFAQGYHFAKPIALTDVLDALATTAD